MSLEAAIQTWWRRSGALRAAAPSERVFTEEKSEASIEVERPYVVVRADEAESSIRTSSGNLLTADHVHFDVYADDLQAGERLASKIVKEFSGATFPIDDGWVQDMKPVRRGTEREGGIWRVRQTFRRRYRRTAA